MNENTLEDLHKKIDELTKVVDKLRLDMQSNVTLICDDNEIARSPLRTTTKNRTTKKPK